MHSSQSKKYTAKHITKALHALSQPSIAAHSKRFFKTGKGEYSETDQFLGIRVPILRKQAQLCQHIDLEQIQLLLNSPYHEIRLCALFILILKFQKADEKGKTDIYHLYLDNTANINNWDLVDSSAYKILGVYLENKDKTILYDLCQSENLWERRISIIATLHFIKSHQFADTLKLSQQLLTDEHDLIHKAVGWMLREIGNRDLTVEQKFLRKHYQKMPRTMLRYAIEKFPQSERKRYLQGTVKT